MIIRANMSVGRMPGSATCQTSCHALAPSMRAASKRLGSMPCMAARKRMTRKPQNVQLSTPMTLYSARLLSPKK